MAKKDDAAEGDPVEAFYGKLQEKYKLPNFQDIFADFELHSIDDTALLLAEIRKKMVDKLDQFTMMLQPVLQPDTTINDLHECRFFSEEEKRPLNDLYARLMALIKRGLKASVTMKEKDDAEYIIAVASQYAELKKSMTNVAERLEAGWKKAEETEEGQWYVG